MKKLLALLLALAMIFTLAACGGSGSSAPASTGSSSSGGSSAPASTGSSSSGGSAPAETAATPGRADGSIIVVQSSDIINWDPCASTDTNTKNCLKNMINRLFETDDYFNNIPILCKEYKQLDKYTWEFKIYEGVKFFDGNELTMEDVVYSLNRAKTTSSSGKTLLGPVEEFNIIDPYTLQIKTSTVYGSLPTALSNTASTILEKSWLEKYDAGQCDFDEIMRNGATGRYYLGERVIGDSIELLPNPNYFDPDDGAKNSKLIFKVIPEATTRTIMLQSGDADLNVNFDTAAMDEVLADKNLELHQQESSTIYYIALNCEKGPFTNKALRQAVAWAINREDCLQVGYEGYGKVWENVWAPTVIGSSDNPSGYTYDPEKAKALVAEAGFANGVDVKACCKTDAEERIAQVVQAYLGQVGINMTYDRIDNTVLTEVMGNNEYDMAFDYTAFYSDPELFFGRQFQASGIGAKNYAHYTSAACDELMDKAKASLDEKERADIYGQINKILCDDCPWIGMFNNNLYCVSRAGLQGVNLNVETTYWYHTLHY